MPRVKKQLTREQIAASQVLVPDTSSPRVDEGLQASVKDPLWFLARQWLTGEFEAENGGRPVHAQVETTSFAMDRLIIDAGDRVLSQDEPLEFAVEAEKNDGSCPMWQPSRLEFAFRAGVGPWRFEVNEYDGHELDWYAFVADDTTGALQDGRSAKVRVIPAPLRVSGMPHPRWWKFEERSLFLEDPNQPEPNLLSVLIPEYAYIDGDNWFILPIEQEVGTLRRVDSITMVDSFGMTVRPGPVQTAADSSGWNVFTIERADGSLLGGEFLLVPNVAANVLSGDIIEEVALIRDESANHVWAIERYYTDETEVRHNRGDELKPVPTIDVTSIAANLADKPVFRLRSHLAENWIPYVPKLLDPGGGQKEQTFLRRARSVETVMLTNGRQYKGIIVNESPRINEEEVPRTGLRIRRLWRFARGSDGQGYFWTGRRKDVTLREASAGLDFDFIK